MSFIPLYNKEMMDGYVPGLYRVRTQRWTAKRGKAVRGAMGWSYRTEFLVVTPEGTHLLFLRKSDANATCSRLFGPQ